MSVGEEPRRERIERLRRLIQEYEEREQQRQRASFENAMAALVQRVSSRPPPPPPDPIPAPPVRTPHAPTEAWWSPHPILGYRMWDLRQGKLHGAWTPWTVPTKTAVCLDKQSKATGPVPHDASECRHPPCGIYALKGTRTLQQTAERAIRNSSVPITIAIGLVAMTGRVVEHESGYRAEHAAVVSLVMITGAVGKHPAIATLDTPDEVLAAFVEPRPARVPGEFGAYPLTEAMNRALRHLRERQAALA